MGFERRKTEGEGERESFTSKMQHHIWNQRQILKRFDA